MRCFTPQHDRIGRFRNGRPDIFVAAARLVPSSRLNVRRCAPALGTQAFTHTTSGAGRIDPHLLGKAMSGILMIASKAPVGLGCSRGRPDDYGRLASVRRAHAGPAVADLMVVNARILNRGRKAEDLRRQTADGGQNLIGRDHAVVLCGHQRDARVDQRLLRVEHVEGGTLTSLGFFAHAVQRDLGRGDLRLRGLHLGLTGLQRTSPLHDRRAGLVAGGFEVETLLRQVFLGLADQRICIAAIVERPNWPARWRTR